MTTAMRRSPVARLSARSGAVFVEEHGWEIPASYGNDAAERAAIRDSVAITDVSARSKVDLRGSVERFATPAGAILARISEDWAIVFGEPGAESRLLSALEFPSGGGPMVTDVTHLFAGFCLAGPGVPALLLRTTSWDLSTLAPREAAGAPIVEIRSIMVRREHAVPMLEVYVAAEYGRYAWESLSRQVAALGGMPVGWQALRAEGWR